MPRERRTLYARRKFFDTFKRPELAKFHRCVDIVVVTYGAGQHGDNRREKNARKK